METQRTENQVLGSLLSSFRAFQSWFGFGYLVLILIGMLFEAMYYRAFGLNIFQYAEVLDFLLAPFRRPISLVMLGIALLAMAMGYWFDRLTERRLPRLHRIFTLGMSRRKWFRQYRVASMLVLFLVLTCFYAWLIGAEARQDILASKNIDLVIVFQDKSSIEGKLIGKNGSYIFLSDTAKAIHVVPLDGYVKLLRPHSPEDQKR
ncbi:MAG: hypothetical protein KDC44_21090 [Phaeodactylibacter sp.]|nr:hypothetical protein [Phaeodactylibacter sp.]